MTVFEIVSVLLALLGLLGGVVGFVRAVAADRRSAFAAAESADARSDAAAALKQSAAATERIAAAVEIIASRQASAQAPTEATTEAPTEATTQASTPGSLIADRMPAVLAELAALIGPREVEWTVERRLPAHSYRLRNVGTVPAREVSLLGGSPPANTSLARIEPGMAIIFSVDPDRHTRAIEVSWLEGTAVERGRLTLPLPSATEPPAR